MKRLFITLVAASLLGAPSVHAQDGPIEGVIASQLDAFKADDFVTAYGFASPMIQRLFGSPERFGQMVRQGYPMVHRPADIRYLDATRSASGVTQRIMVRDTDGVFHVLEYQMIEVDGSWQINGVRLVEAPQVGA